MDSCVTTPTQVTLIQGEDRELFFGVKDVAEGVYINLTGATEISVSIPSTTSGVPVVFLLTATEVVVTDATKGKFKVVASDAKTILAKLGEVSVEIVMDWGTTRRIAQLDKAIVVKKRLVW